ncbi:hypothetical protein JXA59_02855 [Patescibacteria group bacterium]|nr:hypothetical protein [Patescibacteria group bacterium]
MREKKPKLLYLYRVKMATRFRTRIDSGWSRKDITVRAESRGDAVRQAIRQLGYEYLPPAMGTSITKKDKRAGEGRYFLVGCRGSGYVCQAKDARQARAYVINVLTERHRKSGDLGDPPRPIWQVWPVTAVRQRPNEQRREVGLPQVKLTLPPSPWVCAFCAFQDDLRRSSNAKDPCYNCGKTPLTEDEELEACVAARPAETPPLGAAAQSVGATAGLFDADSAPP